MSRCVDRCQKKLLVLTIIALVTAITTACCFQTKRMPKLSGLNN